MKKIHCLGFFGEDYGRTLCGKDCYNSNIESENMRLIGEHKDVNCLRCKKIIEIRLNKIKTT